MIDPRADDVGVYVFESSRLHFLGAFVVFDGQDVFRYADQAETLANACALALARHVRCLLTEGVKTVQVDCAHAPAFSAR
jgi:hypothetical protein